MAALKYITRYLTSEGPRKTPPQHAIATRKEQAGRQSLVAAVHDAGYEVQVVFDGEGTTWVEAFEQPDHPFAPPYQAVKATGMITAVCDLCSEAFGVKQEVGQSGLQVKDANDGHLSFSQLVVDGLIPVII
jgi:hypothetical protein